MTFRDFWQQEEYKTLVGVAVTATGFFCALLVNSLVEDWKGRRTYRSLMRVIRSEAESNAAVYDQSFLALYRDGIIFREFELSAVNNALGNPVFAKNASSAELSQLYEYVRHLTLANVYRGKLESIRFKDDYLKNSSEGASSAWEQPLLAALEEHLTLCKRSIEIVARLGCRHSAQSE